MIFSDIFLRLEMEKGYRKRRSGFCWNIFIMLTFETFEVVSVTQQVLFFSFCSECQMQYLESTMGIVFFKVILIDSVNPFTVDVLA